VQKLKYISAATAGIKAGILGYIMVGSIGARTGGQEGL